MIEFLFIALGAAYVVTGFRFAMVSYDDMEQYTRHLDSFVYDYYDYYDPEDRSRRESYLIGEVRESRRNLFLSPVWPVIIALHIWGSLSDTSKSLESAEKARDERIRDKIRAEIRNAESNMLEDFDNRLNG